MIAEQPERNIELHAGLLVDVETGEILGYSSPEREQWRPGSLDDVEWILSKRYECAVQKRALEQRIANLQRMADDWTRRDFFFEQRYKNDCEAIVAGMLDEEDTRARSIKTEYGDLGFRRTPGSIKARDVPAAVAWAKTHAPEAVKVNESVQVTPLKGRELPPDLFLVTEPEDKFYVRIKTS